MSQYLSSVLCNVTSTLRVFKDKVIEYMNKEDHYKPVKRMFPEYSSLEQTRTFFGHPNHIIDGLYLGSSFNAANYNHLEENKIDIIINVTNEIQNYFPDTYIEGETYFKFGINDTNDDDIDKILDNILEVMTKNKGKNIFIHCYMGLSRSAIAVIYYLMIEHKMEFEDAVIYVKERRHTINPNTKFAEVIAGRQTKLTEECN